MQYSSETQPALDLDHVIDVLGPTKVIYYFTHDIPVSEWELSDHQIERLARGPHGCTGVALLDDSDGLGSAEWEVRCECGHMTYHRLLSQARAAHDSHAKVAPVRRIHTADMLES
jgi:hypothetical protein